MQKIGAPEEIRTPGLLIRSQMLYPAELQAHIPYYGLVGAGEENRTPVMRLEISGNTIIRHPHGGAGRDRTDDLCLAKASLSQLSYGPKL